MVCFIDKADLGFVDRTGDTVDAGVIELNGLLVPLADVTTHAQRHRLQTMVLMKRISITRRHRRSAISIAWHHTEDVTSPLIKFTFSQLAGLLLLLASLDVDVVWYEGRRSAAH